MLDNFKYKGIVRIKINNNLYTINNEGTDVLFKILAKALAGYDISHEKPSILKIQNSSNNNILSVNYLNLFANSYILLESDFGEFAGKWAARYLCYLPGYLKSLNLDVGGKFILANNDANLAEITLTNDYNDVIYDINTLSNDNQALIEWNLLVTNEILQSNIEINDNDINN